MLNADTCFLNFDQPFLQFNEKYMRRVPLKEHSQFDWK